MDIDTFWAALRGPHGEGMVFTPLEVLLNFCIPALLMVPLSWVYGRTHRGVTYSQSFAHTMFLMAVTTSVIMMIIGSNIARAFSLVGALSIIRFRTAIKDSRDTGYIFASIAIGMATGTGMAMVAALFTVLVVGLMLLLHVFRIGERSFADKLLKVLVDDAGQKELEAAIQRHCQDHALIHSEVHGENQTLFTFVVTTPARGDEAALLAALRAVEGVASASLYYSDQRLEI